LMMDAERGRCREREVQREGGADFMGCMFADIKGSFAEHKGSFVNTKDSFAKMKGFWQREREN